jgi:hypothetical protein
VVLSIFFGISTAFWVGVVAYLLATVALASITTGPAQSIDVAVQDLDVSLADAVPARR